MHWPDFILFASDALRYVMAGTALLSVSAFSAWAERRRARRKHPDAVGIMPWRDIGVVSTFAGLALLAFGIMGLIKG